MGVTDGDADEVLGLGDADGETLGLVRGGVAQREFGVADGEPGPTWCLRRADQVGPCTG